MLESSETVLASYLDPGERLLWSGQPRHGIRFRAMDVFVIPFSLMWGGFAFFWEYMALTMTSKAPGPIGIVFPLFGLPFVAVGLYMIFGRFIADARGRARTFYGVTGERILIVSGLFSRQIKTLLLSTLGDSSLGERPDRSGTITFGPGNFMAGGFPAGMGHRRYVAPAFEMIENAREVYDIIRGAQRGATAKV